MKKEIWIRVLPGILVLPAGWMMVAILLYVGKIEKAGEKTAGSVPGAGNDLWMILWLVLVVLSVIFVTSRCVQKNRKKAVK